MITKEEILNQYQNAIDEAAQALVLAQQALETLLAERDAKVAKIEAYNLALKQKQKQEAERILAEGLPE